MERSIGALKLARLGRSDVLRAYVKSYRAGRKCLKACHDNPAPDRLHALRKRVKRLFYESLALHTVPGMGRRIRRSRKLGHLLGEDHDLVTLMGLARRAREKKVGKRIARKRAKMEPRILKLGDKLFRKRPKRMKRKLDS